MNHLLLALILVLPLTLVGVGRDRSTEAALVTFTKTSSVAQAEQAGVEAEDFLITDPAGPFTFKNVGKIRKLTKITITVTLFGGDTGPGAFDENDPTLELDGIDTGIKLNGFRTDQTDTKTISGVPLNESQIRAALKADGKLAATIRDADPDDNHLFGSSSDTTTLVIKGKRRS